MALIYILHSISVYHVNNLLNDGLKTAYYDYNGQRGYNETKPIQFLFENPNSFEIGDNITHSVSVDEAIFAPYLGDDGCACPLKLGYNYDAEGMKFSVNRNNWRGYMKSSDFTQINGCLIYGKDERKPATFNGSADINGIIHREIAESTNLGGYTDKSTFSQCFGCNGAMPVNLGRIEDDHLLSVTKAIQIDINGSKSTQFVESNDFDEIHDISGILRLFDGEDESEETSTSCYLFEKDINGIKHQSLGYNETNSINLGSNPLFNAHFINDIEDCLNEDGVHRRESEWMQPDNIYDHQYEPTFAKYPNMSLGDDEGDFSHNADLDDLCGKTLRKHIAYSCTINNISTHMFYFKLLDECHCVL